MLSPETRPESFAVIGGEGFVGQAIVQELLKTHAVKAVASLGLTQRTFEPKGYRFFRADVTSLDDLTQALTRSGATTVFHTASPHTNAHRDLHERVNIEGSRAVIEACRLTGVTKLIYTSSITVSYDGFSLTDIDERLPWTTQKDTAYTYTKARGEEIVLSANGETLRTCALRCSGIIGPGDRQVIPGFLGVLRNRQTIFQVGTGHNLFDMVDVRNVAYAHVLAARRLADEPFTLSDIDVVLDPISHLSVPYGLPPSSRIPSDKDDATATPYTCVPHNTPTARHKFDPFSATTASDTFSIAGQAFVITNGEPLPFWSIARAVWFLYAGHVPPFRVILWPWLALLIAYVYEGIFNLFRIPIGDAGFTAERIRYVTGDMYCNIEKARRVLGYEPIISLEQSLRDSVAWFKEQERRT